MDIPPTTPYRRTLQASTFVENRYGNLAPRCYANYNSRSPICRERCTFIHDCYGDTPTTRENPNA